MTDKIGVGLLRNIGVLYEGDIYELAYFLLKVHDAKDKGTNSKSRHTVNGLVRGYAMITGVDFNRVMTVIAQYGLPLGATIEYDEDMK